MDSFPGVSHWEEEALVEDPGHIKGTSAVFSPAAWFGLAQSSTSLQPCGGK